MEDKFYLDLVPLTKKETALREKLEERIFHTVRQAYIDIGALLAEINEKRLYRSTHQTFAKYSAEVLDMAKRTAYKYIEANEVVKNLCAIVDKDTGENVPNWAQNTTQLPEITLPQNESQARALVGLSPEEQRKVWSEAVETAEGRITAAHIRKTVRELGLAKIEEKTIEAKETRKYDGTRMTAEGRITAAHIRKTVRELGLAKIEEKTIEAKETRKYDGTRMSDEFKKGFNGFLAAIQTEITSNWKTTDRLTVVKHLDAMRNTISENGNHRIPDRGYSLEASNLEKLEAAGFILYRPVKGNMLIERHYPGKGWIVVETYEDVQAMETAFEELLKTQTHLRG